MNKRKFFTILTVVVLCLLLVLRFMFFNQNRNFKTNKIANRIDIEKRIFDIKKYMVRTKKEGTIQNVRIYRYGNSKKIHESIMCFFYTPLVI